MRTRSEGVCPLARERSRSRAPRVLGTRTVIRCETMCQTLYHKCQTVVPSALPQVNRAIAGADDQRIAAAIELAAHFVFANLAFGCDGHIEIDVAVAGMQVHVGREVSGNFESDAAVAGLQPPACSQG